MATEHLMTVQELYDFAKQYGFENAKIWIPTSPNIYSSVSSANLSISSTEVDETKRIYLVYNS